MFVASSMPFFLNSNTINTSNNIFFGLSLKSGDYKNGVITKTVLLRIVSLLYAYASKQNVTGTKMMV